ncbi:hypothetical protein PVAP13_2NG131703 [Panicum virgatum]|uniref:Uncharacterized protein n=1 Tax=Panicum virgatum TaxID=38727 RepID=A0A8T0V855_PANVG|nr:hypothetical protein PVAP13_2NG131703 [Panicum virgatum]
MSIPYAPHPTSFHHYSSWGWDDTWAHAPYFRPYHVEYAAPREPVHAGQPHIVNDHFISKNRSTVHEKTKVVKQVYVVKNDGHKNISSDLNSISKQTIVALRTSPIDDVERKEHGRRSKKRSSNMRFAPNHLNYWSIHHPFDSQMPHMPMSWTPSYNMLGYPSYFTFYPWLPYGSLYQGGLPSDY